MSQATLPPPAANLNREDVALLAEEFDRELERRRRGRAEGIRRKYWTAAEAHEMARRGELPPSWRLDEIREKPLRELTWDDLNELAQENTEEALQKWSAVKAQAAFEWEYRACVAASGGETCCSAMDRAVYGQVAADLRKEWQPTGTSEELLIRTLAQSATLAEKWLTVSSMQAHSSCDETQQDLEDRGYWKGPRAGEMDAQIHAAQMYDRWNKIFLRTLRALRDLRRYHVVIQNAPGGQVNVAGQQVNVQRTERGDPPE